MKLLEMPSGPSLTYQLTRAGSAPSGSKTVEPVALHLTPSCLPSIKLGKVRSSN